MSVYVMGDIHGEYDMFLKMLDKLSFKDSDELYLIGDVVDRGPHPIKVLQKIMEMPNVIPIVGNHELMALEGLKFLNSEITEESIASIESETLDNLLLWQLHNGGDATVREFRTLNAEEREEILDFLLEFSMYEEVSVGGSEYLLVHGGLGNYSPDKAIDDYSLKDLVWTHADYDTQHFKDTIVVTGHTPTQLIQDNDKPGFIYRKNNHIAIDCGACFDGGRLAAIRLDDGEEFYVEREVGIE
ncbi:MAG: fructose-bisphosphatase class III [Lachnospiraceae bacterium]|nr:fructose-bisphosphatase class III [Lachnospiraceae bacterium]